MALTGELTDLSLAELIEFFCNQRKTGRLTVSYPQAPAYFYLLSGAVVHASIGDLRGIEAVYYALTQSNANFNFSTAYEPPDHTINQPWTSVVLEGLRRMDEGIKPRNPVAEKIESVEPKTVEPKSEQFVASQLVEPPPAPRAVINTASPVVDEAASIPEPAVVHEVEDIVSAELEKASKPAARLMAVAAKEHVVPENLKRPVITPLGDGFLSSTHTASRFSSGPWKVAAIFAALILIVAGVAVPWYARGRAAKAANQQSQLPAEASNQTASQPLSGPDNSAQAAEASQSPEATNAPTANADAADVARREREARAREEARLKAKASESSSQTTPAQVASSASSAQSPANNGPKKVSVQVTYDENGRVTQATGSDPTALRIARQKRFPPGKAGSTTITIPIN